MNAGALAARALKKAKDSTSSTALDPGDYTVILEPAAVADLIGFSFIFGLSARDAEEGRSYFSKKGGGTMVGEKGVLRSLSYDRYWAKKAGREPTPSATNFILEGGTETLEGLIASTDRGLLVTHFWYIRTVNPQTLQLTGLTRDGLWLVENGKIVRPVVNLRFNESPAVLLNNVLGMTPAVRVGNAVVPAIKAANFTFSSLSDAV